VATFDPYETLLAMTERRLSLYRFHSAPRRGLLIPLIMVSAVSLGSLFWMHKKVDRWVQNLLDDHTHAASKEMSEISAARAA
jgi:hypothetical protein